MGPFGLDHARMQVAERLALAPMLTEGRAWNDVPIVHFVAHGAYRSEHERGAALVLGPDEFLLADDVERLALGGLVILSSCGSAQGPPRVGDDELTHLGGSFLRAGARAVILARARVEYGATQRLMETLYARLAEGASPAEALRAGRVALSESGIPWWQDAHFQVLGQGWSGLR